VLRNIELSIAPGEIVGLFGANGSGKTTLLHCLAGASRPTAGEVFWFGEAAAHSPAARRLVGMLGHESGLYLAMTPWENLCFAGQMYGVDQVDDRAAELLSAIGLKAHAQQPAGGLSRGMRQRLAIARAVIHDPPILLLDEPFTSLDTKSCGWLGDFLRQLREKNRAIVISSHDAEQSRPLTDRCVGLQGGRLHAVEDATRRAALPRAVGMG
jgi:heme exporter protein A